MANSDLGHKLTDKELAKLERRIAKLYREAGKELQATIDAYFEQFKKRDEEMKALIGTVQNGKEWTEADYKQWRLNQIGRGERYQVMRDKVAHRVTDANAVAVSYTNDATPGIYSLNRNYSAYTIEQVTGNVGFDLWDEQTVKRLIVEQPDLMPYYPPKRALKRGIDLAYGKKQITASVTSSILQGKSIKHMADDLQKRITTMSRDSAIRTARTAVTGAQNAGRMDSYAAAEKMGIKLKKQWLATLDGKTRHAHAMLDGQTVDIDKPFKVDGDEIMFPGDTSAPGYLVYNCRCTMVVEVDGVDTSDGLRRTKNPATGETEVISDMTYAEWAGWKKAEAKKGNKTFNTVKEAEAWMHDQGIDFVILNGADAKTASTIANAVNTLPPGITPKAITDLTSFKKGFGGKLQRKDAQIYGVTLDNLWGINFGDGMRDYDGGVMVGFNFRNYKNADAISKSKEYTNKRYMEKTGHMWHFNLSGEATYYHEIGHAYAELKRELPTGFHEAVQKWYKESQCDILQKDSEAWAEAWAAYHLGDSRLPDYIAEFIKGVY
jgi:SPP1 gp7 family putative phage head morphogenesis protein